MVSTKPSAGLSRPPRASRQVRSEETQAKIAQAVVFILADEGPGALTHRRVARVAGVSLASTTYHYQNKFDMIAAATERLLAEYVQSFVRVIDRHRSGDPVVSDFPQLIFKLIINAAGHHGRKTLAWCEIMLDCARSTAGHVLARRWLNEMDKAWTELAFELHVEQPSDLVRPAIDTVMGLLFLTKALDLSPAQIDRLFCAHETFDQVVGSPVRAGPASGLNRAQGMIRAPHTRERIVGSAVQLLIAGDLGPLSYRAVAERSDLTSAAVAYHFPMAEMLYEAAQRELFDRSLRTYVGSIDAVTSQKLAGRSTVDLAFATFIREVTEYGPLHLASFSVWLDATRKVALKPLVMALAHEMLEQWSRWLETIGAPERPDYALIALGHYIGKVIRALSTGVAITDLAQARAEFGNVLQNLADAECPFSIG